MKKLTVLISIYLLLLSTLPGVSDAKSERIHPVSVSSGIEYVNLDFWDSFGDECLKEHIIDAVKNNYDLKNATLKTEEYKKFVNMSFGRELPNLTVGVQADWLRSPMVDIGAVAFSPRSTGIYSVPLMVSYEADIFLKNRGKTKAAQKAFLASTYAEKAAYISVVSAVATVYYNLVNVDELLNLQENILKLKTKNAELIALRVREGISARAELNLANEDVINAQIEYNNLKKQQSELINQLCILTGKSTDNIQEIKRTSINDISLNFNVPSQIESEVVFSRPDIQQVEAELEKAKIDISTARKELLPVVPLFGVLGFGTSEFSELFSKDAFFALMGASAMQTLFAGGAKINNLKLKKIQYEEMFNKYRQTDLVALKEVNDALYGIKTAQSNLDNMQKMSDFEQENFGYSDKKYTQGVYSLLQKNSDEIKKLSVQKGYSTAKSNFLVSYITLYKATGAKL